MSLDVEKARSHFPALSKGYIYADSAGGSQCLKDVVDRISDYLLYNNVQLGADYSVSVESTKRVAQGPEETAKLVNASSSDEIVFGSSSTMLVENLTRAMESNFLEGDEIIITGEHESNAGPWKKLAARRGLTIKVWEHTVIPNSTNPYAVELAIPTLISLITAKTRIVAFTACSNILGSIVDVAEVVHHVKTTAAERGARKVEVCVDCVAYAPHRRIDVKKWDVDYCFFSYYKVYGPHVSILYIRKASLISLGSLAHHFITRISADKPYKLQPGGPGYETVYATTSVLPYLASLAPEGSSDPINAAFELIAQHEQSLLQPLIQYLTSPEARERGVRIVGSEKTGLERVPTVSFVVVGPRATPSKEIVHVFDAKGNVGIRWGHFYAYTLVDNLRPKLPDEDGVVRISLVHYNTLQEVERLVEILKEALA